MEDIIKLLESELGELRLKKSVNLADYTRYLQGVNVPILYIAADTRELIKIVELCRELNIKYLIIGSGSKIRSEDLEGVLLVIKNRSDSMRIFGIKGKVSKDGLGIQEAFLEADSGVSLDRLSQYSQAQKLGSFEALNGVTCTIGGSILNLLELRQNIYQVKILNHLGVVESVGLPEIDHQSIILSVVFKLKAGFDLAELKQP